MDKRKYRWFSSNKDGASISDRSRLVLLLYTLIFFVLLIGVASGLIFFWYKYSRIVYEF